MSTEIRFYHLTSKSLDQALPEILTKALSGERRILVKTGDEKQLSRMNEHLWTFDPNSFLPHGTEKDGHSEDQPIFLTAKDENPNGAEILILTDGATSVKCWMDVIMTRSRPRGNAGKPIRKRVTR